MRKTDVRQELQSNLEQHFVQDKEKEWVSVEKININRIDIRIVSEKDENINEIEKLISNFIEECNVNLENYEKIHLGFLNVHTLDEAEIIGIERPMKKSKTTASFGAIIDNNENNIIDNKEPSKPCKIISFYSYKGGVGRTIALMQTANLLALEGKKVALIDLDIEAPSFNEIFSDSIQSDKGLVNYLYNKLYNLDKIEVSSIVSKLQLNAKGDVYIIPAGSINKKYVKMLDALKEKRISENGYIEELIDELYKNYDIDYVLIDSRTGINNWGALAIGEIADEVMLFAYPNEENVKGINLILDMIQDRKKCTVVFSRIADTDEGKNKAKELFDKIDVEQEFIGIEYDSAIAVSSKYPIENKLNKFSCLSNFILEDEINESNNKWINDNKEAVYKILECLSKGEKFNNIITNDEMKFIDRSNFVVIKNNKINLNDIIIGSEEKSAFIELNVNKIRDISSEQRKYAEVFIAEILANSLLSYKLKISNIKGFNSQEYLKNHFDILIKDINYKVNDLTNFDILFNRFEGLLSEFKEKMQRIYFEISINDLLSYIKNIPKETEFHNFNIVIAIIGSLNKTQDIQFKVVFDEDQYIKYEEQLKEVKGNLLNLSWRFISKEILIDNIRQILNETSTYIYESTNEKDNSIFNKQVNNNNKDSLIKIMKMNNFIKMQNKYDTNLIYCKRVDSTKFSKEFVNWLSEKMQEKNMLSKKDVLDIIKEAAKIEIETGREDKNSILTFESFDEVIEK